MLTRYWPLLSSNLFGITVIWLKECEVFHKLFDNNLFMQFIDDAITDFVKSGNETSQRVGEMVKQKLSSFLESQLNQALPS